MDREGTVIAKSDNIFNFHGQNIWLLLLPALFFLMKKKSGTISFSEIDHAALEKKTKLLNRIKGYMSPEEQVIVHKAETILFTAAKIKSIFDGPDVTGAQTHFHSLSVEERKKNMLMDISEFVDHERREAIYKAVELHSKAKTMEALLDRIQPLSANELSIETIERYIDAFDPILEGDLRSRSKELRKIIGVIKLIKSLNNKNGLNEMDLIEAVKPFMQSEQAENIGRMLQIIKAVSTIGNEASEAGGDKSTASGKPEGNAESMSKIE